VALVVMSSPGSARDRRHGEDEEEFEQELIDQDTIAGAAAGTTDRWVAQDRLSGAGSHGCLPGAVSRRQSSRWREPPMLMVSR
jgi:hypothetical protein